MSREEAELLLQALQNEEGRIDFMRPASRRDIIQTGLVAHAECIHLSAGPGFHVCLDFSAAYPVRTTAQQVSVELNPSAIGLGQSATLQVTVDGSQSADITIPEADGLSSTRPAPAARSRSSTARFPHRLSTLM